MTVYNPNGSVCGQYSWTWLQTGPRPIYVMEQSVAERHVGICIESETSINLDCTEGSLYQTVTVLLLEILNRVPKKS